MARSHRPIGSRPRVAPTYGPGGAPAPGVGVQRGGGGGALADAAGWTEVAERCGVSNAALKLTELTTGGVRWQVLPQWRHLLFGPNGLRLDEWLRSGLAHVVKNGPHRTVYRIALPGECIYLKHHRLPDVRAWL